MKPFKVFVGWDKKDALAYEVCAHSLVKHSSIDLEIIPLHDWKLRHSKIFWRSHIVDETGQMVDRGDKSKFSTDFSFTRFCVPKICGYADEWVLFCDADMLWRDDIAKLLPYTQNNQAVQCVKHEHIPFEATKMFGLKQTYYKRKNWSSFMLMNPSKCNGLTLYAINNWSGETLHSMLWVDDSLIGSLPEEWNYLVGHTDPLKVKNPSVVHFTLGTPDMPECENVEYADEWKAYLADITAYGHTKVGVNVHG